MSHEGRNDDDDRHKYKVGDKVMFGRPNGEQTRGTPPSDQGDIMTDCQTCGACYRGSTSTSRP